jgi:integrase/recombinase XerD
MAKKVAKKKYFYDDTILMVENFERNFNEFLERTEKDNKSKFTIKYYKESINVFLEFILEYEDMQPINQELIDEYKDYLNERHKGKATTINSRLTAIKSVLNFLKRRGILKLDIHIKKLTESNIHDVYTVDEVKTLLQRPKQATFEDFRTYIFVNFLIGCPLRLQALREIKWKDIMFDTNILILRADINKTKKDDSFQLPQSLLNILIEFKRKMNYDDEDYVFTKANKQQISERGLQNAISRYNIKRGVKKTSIHLFRHFCGQQSVLAGSPEMLLMRLLGHKTSKMANRYANIWGKISPEALKYNPLEIIKASEKYKKPVKNKPKLKSASGRKKQV